MSDQSDKPEAQPGPSIAGIEIKRVGYSLYIRIPDNRLECRCSYVPREQGSMMNRDDLAGFLKQHNVREGINQQAFDDFAVMAAAGKQQIDVLLASGTPALVGADAYLDISVEPSGIVRDGEDESTNINMHIVQTFINVSKGEQIGRIIPPQPGQSGRDILGGTIPAQPGKPFNLKIGKNILTEDEGRLLIAAACGRFCQSSGEVSVEEEYIVAGDVNFKVGSITFKGFVDVRGDILDNFDIYATKGLRVSGNIGVCNIVSEGDITFCGMDGQDHGKIVCGGTLRAHFIHDTTIECAGDVIIDVEIHNCHIKTTGKIVVDKGAISGGSYIALGGMEANKLGSPASVKTKLVAGVEYHDLEELETLFAALADNHTKSGQSQSLQETEEFRKERAVLTDRIHAIRSKVYEVANAKINVKKNLYDCVHLCLGTVNEEIIEQKNGSFSIVENTIEGGLRFLSMTNLNVKATDIELAFIREQKKFEKKQL